MITAIICLIFESLSTSYGYEMNTGVSRSTPFEPTIKHLMKKKILGRRSARNLVRKVHYVRVKIFIMEKLTLKSMSGYSRYNTKTKILI